MAKQQQHSNSKNKIDLIQMQQNTTTSAVVVRSHKSEEAFQNYHQSNPYLNDVVGCLNGDDEEKVGARRLSDYLAKHHKNEFIDAANASGVAVCGVLDATESASLFTEAGLVDEQCNTIIAAKKRAAVNNSDIQAQNRKTKKSRGSYDKGN